MNFKLRSSFILAKTFRSHFIFFQIHVADTFPFNINQIVILLSVKVQDTSDTVHLWLLVIDYKCIYHHTMYSVHDIGLS